MRLTKLRLSGFKSFVEPTEFLIQPGLTGVVGPNGCGKSNLVEALRWVMGETSAKQMRGGGMEDVIFNGTNTRPARNIATVALSINNSQRLAPSRFNNDEEIEITRFIERGEGSTYSVNGEEVRARDVQLLFADFATGAHSSALVGQGRVNDLINAKPSKRRGLLEEASGITGLHARRHEAELRLRGAANNLERLQDVVGTLEGQLHGLKRQARQANRYRKIAEKLKKTEATLLHLRWSISAKAVEEADTKLKLANEKVQKQVEKTVVATNEREKAAENLPALRMKESEYAASVQRLSIASDRLTEEERQIETTRSGLIDQIEQIDGDLYREGALASDAHTALKSLMSEITKLIESSSSDEELINNARSKQLQAREAVEGLEHEINELTEYVAATEARLGDLQNRNGELDTRDRRLRSQLEELTAAHAEIQDNITTGNELKALTERVETSQATYLKAREKSQESAKFRDLSQAIELEKRDLAQATETKLGRLKAESEAIKGILGQQTDLSSGIVTKIEVRPGYEAALGVGLGDDLEAPANDDESIHWAIINSNLNLNPLPEGSKALSNFVKAPIELESRLTQIGVVNDSDGPKLRKLLSTGQRLVSTEGSLWRWDGYTVTAGASTPSAARLKQQNRLVSLETELTKSEKAHLNSKNAVELAMTEQVEATKNAELSRQVADEAAEKLNNARDQQAESAGHAAALNSRIEGLLENINHIKNDLAECTASKKLTLKQIEDIPASDSVRLTLQNKREALTKSRLALEEKNRNYEGLTRDSTHRKNRIKEIEGEKVTWSNRVELADRRLTELSKRKVDAEKDLAQLDTDPEVIDAKRKTLLNKMEQAEVARAKAADILTLAETNLNKCERSLKNEENELAASREARIREEGLVEQCIKTTEIAAAQIRERLECDPEEAAAIADLDENKAIPDTSDIESTIQRLTRERENIGPVNLRAETEASEIESQISSLTTEREDLETAISKLRQGISSLNREGRERIMGAFGEIDKHFQDLFSKLFGGGNAHLELVGSDDPLEAGLEIMASPPGKRLQVLSLLSGGEKALTATALIFAAFLTNPAPICVLDEVDAPLDDTNVNRFCNLVSDLAKATNTRFIVITHHRMTMTKVDRLYGVTMAERGVSQLVSVSLDEAAHLRK